MNLKLQSPNNRFEHNERPSKGSLGQRSPKVPEGHQGSPSQKAKNLQYLVYFKIFTKPEVCNISL